MKYALAGLAVIIATATPAYAVGLGVKAGTLGLGVEATTSLSPHFNVRFGANAYSYSFDETASDIRYEADIDLRSGAMILDWHPFAGTFRLSAGIVYNKNEVDVRATPTGSGTIGGNPYNQADIGTVSGNIAFKKSAPYAGFGWGNAVSKGSPIGFTAEIGALFQGKPDVTLRSSTGAVSQADLQREEQEVEADLDDYEIYPVVSFGLSYRF